jgi:hypothetical protein
METTDGNTAKAIIRRNNEEVQGRGDFDVFDELFADDFIDRTPQVGWGSDKAAVRGLYGRSAKHSLTSGPRFTGNG